MLLGCDKEKTCLCADEVHVGVYGEWLSGLFNSPTADLLIRQPQLHTHYVFICLTAIIIIISYVRVYV